jgi:hypothetical protein
MTSIIEKISNGLTKLKAITESPSTIGERDKIVKQLKTDLTFLMNIPPCFEPDPKECILAREVYEYATFLSVEK